MLEIVSKLFEMAPQKYAQQINEVTGEAAGVKIEKLAAMEEKLNLSYRQSQFFRSQLQCETSSL